MKLLVLGATGATGTALTELALARDHQVTVYVRNPGKMTIHHPELRVAEGQLADVGALTAAMNGADAVLSTLGQDGKVKNPTLMQDALRSVTEAAGATGVQRVIVLSAIGAGESASSASSVTALLSKTIMGEAFVDKDHAERDLRATALNWTIVYASRLTSTPATGNVRIAAAPEKLGISNKIARADVAAFMLDCIGDTSTVRRGLVITTT
jgi:putative NADH-flavin reductase